jgi:diguanylate cyclase (GGDEF)-like protein/PAS domain S-box-containing protein
MASANAGRGPGLGWEDALGLLRAVPHGVAVVDAEGRFSFANDACARLLAWSDAAGLLGRPWREVHDPEEADRLEREGFAPARGGQAWRGDATARRHDGVHIPLEMVIAPLGEGRVALALRDLSEQRRAEEGLLALVYRDPHTGLPNRRLFEDRLAIALAQAHRYRHRLAVIFLDLDRFKQVNDTLGHAAGDALLKAVSERLAESVREGDTVARLAGDEFTLLLPGIHYAEDLATISRKLVEALRQPFHVDGQPVRITASGGISLYPEDGEEAEALLKSADTAMYRAKELGRDNFQLFSPAMAEKALERRALEESLRRALDREEMTLHYQPCLELATGRVVGMEALLRWRRPELGLLEPKDFIALADFTGVMLSVGPWVLETACRQARDWQRRGSRGLRVMVNLSAHELQQGDLVVNVERALAASGLDPNALHLEIPEGYAMQDLDRTVETLRALRSVGVHLSIDGFGAGFSSLAHLRRLPVDALKIDLSFVRGATTDPDDASVVTAVIAVAHSLGLRVVALGVETEAQVTLLRSLGCDEVQGYLWSPPVPPDRCERMLADGVLPAPSFPPRTRRGRPGPPRSRRGRSAG